MELREMGELLFIEKLKREAPENPPQVVKGIGDDAAVLKGEGGMLLLATTDMMVEGVHFTLDTASPEEVGYKALAANLSDIAAMGGIPQSALISLGLSPQQEVEWAQGLYKGLFHCADEFQVSLVGGDTVSSPLTILNIALLGKVEEGRCLYREGANPGDLILVTGELGGSAAYLDYLLHPSALSGENLPPGVLEHLRRRHFRPIPRVREMRAATIPGGITSAIDISDGLASELHHLARSSGKGMLVEAERLPLSPGVERMATLYKKDPLEYALYGGEDYEILFTCHPQKVSSVIEAIQKATSTPVTVIGQVLSSGRGVFIKRGEAAEPLKPGGYEHLR